ncbi:hypothetical protein [uncultured Desulfobacter sp.]|uniref:hypothetical protein n=1 Tax=uncultured Desulfobacter sp. TaxID=240139 RepID=UPI0029F4BB83|nr:hypothetical protein [uncultured Desulfobacter sp.]
MKPDIDFQISAVFYFLAALIVILIPSEKVDARMITQLTPTLTITEEYNDNYFQTDKDPFEEWITSYGLGFSIGLLTRKTNIVLEYEPEYMDFKNLDDRDGFDHNASFSGDFKLTRHTQAKADIVYDGDSDNKDGESWEHSASASIDSQLSRTVNASLSYDYAKTFNQQDSTGTYREYETNTAYASVQKVFNARNSTGANFTYESRDYKTTDADTYDRYSPKAFIKYWMTPLDGVEVNAEYENKDFSTASGNDYSTIAGDIRYIRKFNRHLDGYIKYRHYLSDRTDGDHRIYHPSVGIDWDITEDSGISLGVGVLFHQWDNENDDSQDPFIDLNAYKIFNFSPKGVLSFTAKSKYEESDEDSASLGYNITYELGAKLNYDLTRHISSSLYGSYKLQDFQEATVDRMDHKATFGGSLIWHPLKWLQLSADVSHTSFNSDDDSRKDYEENKVTFLIRLIPETPIRADSINSRKSLEDQLFN